MTRLQDIAAWNGGKRTTEVPCMECGKMIRAEQNGVADLDGPAYRAYYHAEHAPKVLCSIDGRTDHDTDSHDLLWGYKQLHIEGRRWFERTNGNTYHSVRIIEGGNIIAHIPFEYGYGDQYLQTALDWLKANGRAPADAKYGTRYLREQLHATYSVQDVERKKDL